MRLRVLTMAMLFSLTTLLLISCSSDPTDTGDPDPDTGTVVIDALPDSLNSSWSLIGPDSYSAEGNGDSTLAGMAVGDYSITWGTVEYWSTPEGETLTLDTDGAVTFSGIYVEKINTIVVDTSPDSISPSWTLLGPDSYSTDGSGDSTLIEMALGEYSVAWNPIDDWLTPPSDTLTMTKGATLTFGGEYKAVGTIVINPSPDIISAPWTLVGPDPFLVSSNGDSTMTDLFVGEYTVTWDHVAGYITPPSSTQTLTIGSTITFAGVHIELPPLPAGFVPIPAGSFTMGSPESEPGRWDDEEEHNVTLTKPIHMFGTEITNQQFADLAQWALDHAPPLVTATSSGLLDALDGSTEMLLDMESGDCEISFSSGLFTVESGREDHPVVEVTWYGAVSYCDWLSLQAAPPLPRAYDHSTWLCNGQAPYRAQGYRLPTEAEWEYACRAGSETAFATGGITELYCDLDPVLDEIGWYCGNDPGWSYQVGQKISNAWGLYDMHGNLREWCNDYYGKYGVGDTDPIGSVSGSDRVLRGGSWGSTAKECRSAQRYDGHPDGGNQYIGFRVVRATF